MMIRCCLMMSCLAVALLSLGCCGPMGPGCNTMGCNDCDGYGSNRVLSGPLDGLRNFKRSLVCGGGCGETYVGEWISTPPDAQDPCCGDQWVGGATPCRPFCWQPGTLLRGFYGSRFCSGSESSAPCGCGEICDGSCGGGEIIDGGYFDGGYINGRAQGGGSGCTSCAQNARPYNTQMANRSQPAPDMQTRSARQMDAQVNRIRR